MRYFVLTLHCLPVLCLKTGQKHTFSLSESSVSNLTANLTANLTVATPFEPVPTRAERHEQCQKKYTGEKVYGKKLAVVMKGPIPEDIMGVCNPAYKKECD